MPGSKTAALTAALPIATPLIGPLFQLGMQVITGNNGGGSLSPAAAAGMDAFQSMLMGVQGGTADANAQGK
ncbi:hypothetical protein LTR66_001413 [Elasticomyces elasticus]|nr:hypothetical protein LTR66_001413 [Elasticomyces elasticus]